MVNAQILEKNKKRLLEEKARLEKLLSRVANKDEAGGDFHAKYPDMGSDEDSSVAEVAAFETNIAEEHDLDPRLHKVIRALKRMEEGTYGICQVDGEVIDPARLEAAPEAENCIEHEPR